MAKWRRPINGRYRSHLHTSIPISNISKKKKMKKKKKKKKSQDDRKNGNFSDKKLGFSFLRRWHICLFSACSMSPVPHPVDVAVISFAYPIIMQMSRSPPLPPRRARSDRPKLEKRRIKNSAIGGAISRQSARPIMTSLIIRLMTSSLPPPQRPISRRQPPQSITNPFPRFTFFPIHFHSRFLSSEIPNIQMIPRQCYITLGRGRRQGRRAGGGG